MFGGPLKTTAAVGAMTLKGRAFVVCVGFVSVTEIWRTWTVRKSDAGMIAVSVVLFTNVVGMAVPFIWATAVETNPVPVSVMVCAAAPSWALLLERPVSVTEVALSVTLAEALV
jgi:hypothetical protein